MGKRVATRQHNPAQARSPQKGLASTSHTTTISPNSGSSLNHRSAVGEGSDLPFAAPFSSGR